jgi:drug/metabolite transporter (DMT)-like permease
VSGALATRRASALTVTMGMQFVGLLAMLPVLWLLPGRPSSAALGLGALAGLSGSLGLILSFRSMAIGPIGIISPLAALAGVGVPITWGVLISGDDLSAVQGAGLIAGLLAVLAVAYVPGARVGGVRRSQGPLAALVAGATFGLFFVALDATPGDSGLWPLVGSRLAGLAVVTALFLLWPTPAPTRDTYPLIALSGVADATANALFLLASRSGLLSVVSLLASLYPVVALVVGRLWLAERLTWLQSVGVLAAMVATGLVIAG